MAACVMEKRFYQLMNELTLMQMALEIGGIIGIPSDDEFMKNRNALFVEACSLVESSNGEDVRGNLEAMVCELARDLALNFPG